MSPRRVQTGFQLWRTACIARLERHSLDAAALVPRGLRRVTPEDVDMLRIRIDSKIAMLSLAVLLVACSRDSNPSAELSEDLKRDLAAASVDHHSLAAAERSYQPMRFVSAIERPAASAPVKRKAPRRAPRPDASRRPSPAPTVANVPDPVETTVAAAPMPAPASVQEAPAPEPTIVIAQAPGPDQTSFPAGGPTEEVVLDRGRGRGIGGMLGGIIGAVVIRGGHGGRDKCDPRTDGRRGGIVVARGPDLGMPLPTGQTFPRSRLY